MEFDLDGWMDWIGLDLDELDLDELDWNGLARCMFM